MSASLPVYLITGLLGSGKTTLLKHLIRQKPINERWAILINEFGEVDIDSQILQSAAEPIKQTSPANTLLLEAVSGGCICCTAQITLANTLNKLLQDHEQIDRLFIEPTGLGHPAKVIDTLTHGNFSRKLHLQKTFCVITPLQLTPERWQKSQVMRDLIHLADTIVLNKTDLASQSDIEQAKQLLKQCYPPKTEVCETRFAQIELSDFLKPPVAKGLTILGIQQPAPLLSREKTQQQLPYASQIESTFECYAGRSGNRLMSMGWVWKNNLQFNRTELKTLFEKLSPYLSRAKGILKTGKEWQLVQWSDGNLEFSDMAWRHDSRLECLFKEQIDTEFNLNESQLETWIESTLYRKQTKI